MEQKIVVTDFEYAAMQAVEQVFGQNVEIHGCFFHLCQATWQKIQELGLATKYKQDSDFAHFCGMLDGLAFLPTDSVSEGLTFLKGTMPPAAVTYFEAVYVNGTRRDTAAA